VTVEGKALLVEDEALVAMIAEEILLAIGFEPVCVDAGAPALTQLEQGGYRVAVIDVGLPDMRGDDLAARLRTIHPDLGIVLASGYDETDLRRRFTGDSRVAVLGKPYTERDLREAIALVSPLGSIVD
jgi:CheY-like chemotaxis protein